MGPVHQPEKKRRISRERMRLATYRVKAHLWSEKEETLSGFVFLGDLQDVGINVYLNRRLAPGMAVRFSLEREDSYSYRGIVVWSGQFTIAQKFVGHEALKFRSGIRCLFGSEAERQRYLAFVRELKKRTTEIKMGL